MTNINTPEAVIQWVPAYGAGSAFPASGHAEHRDLEFSLPSAFACVSLSAECPAVSSIANPCPSFKMPRHLDLNSQAWCSSLGAITNNALSVQDEKLSKHRQAVLQSRAGKCTHPSKPQGHFCRKHTPILPVWALWTPFVLPPSGIYSAVRSFPQKSVSYVSLSSYNVCSLNAELIYYLLLNSSVLHIIMSSICPNQWEMLISYISLSFINCLRVNTIKI